MSSAKAIVIVSLCVVLAFGLVACGGSRGGGGGGKKKVTKYTISGTVSGVSGSGLVLEDNGGDDLAIINSGAFAFANKVASGKDYAVTVLTQPTNPNQTCTVNSGTGTVSGTNVTNVSVVCSTDTYTISGSVTGLSGSGLVLQDNGGDDLPINSNGSFIFNAPVADGAGYVVTVLTQPSTPNQTCTVNGGTGTVNGTDVTNVTVTCSTTAYTISGSVSGLSGSGLVLVDNGGDNLPVNGNGSFVFNTPVVDGANYEVTVLTQPHTPSQTCSIYNGTGTVSGADVTDIMVTCSTNTYTISGTVSGLSGSGLVLQDNGGDNLPITANGSFTFTNSVADSANYAVTVLTQPSTPNQTCTVGNGSGTVSGADVTNVTVTCSTNAYTMGGTVSGLSGSGLVLQDNGGDDLPISGDGTFIFNTPVADGANYEVTILTQPHTPSQTCTVNSGTGIMNGTDVTDVTVTCSTNTYTIGGDASGIINTVVLQNNGGDNRIINASGPFTFPTPVADSAGYNVTVLSENGMDCSLTNSSGTVSGADVTDVALACIPASNMVETLYPANGANWNDYVKNDGADRFTASDTACTGSETGGYSACLHGGEMRVLSVPNVFSCAGVTASDALGAFDWTCDESTSPVRMVSTGLKDGKHLSDLIDFGTPAWKTNSVSVDAGLDSFATSPAVWWSNAVVVDNDGGNLDNAGTIYVVTGTANLASGFSIGASKVGLVAQPGATINGSALSGDSVINSADGSIAAKYFLWLEGDIDASGNTNGVLMNTVSFSRLDNVKADNADEVGVYLSFSSNNTLTDITAESNKSNSISLYQSSNNTLRGVTVESNGVGVSLVQSSNNTLTGVTANNSADGVDLYQSSNNTLTGVMASYNTMGVYLETSSNNNTLSGVTVNSDHSGVFLKSSSNNTLTGVTANNSIYGVDLYQSSNNTFTGVTVTNNAKYGVWLYSSSNSNTFSGVTVSNNGQYGVWLNSSSNSNTFSGVTASNNGTGILLSSSDNNTLSGITSTNNYSDGVNLSSSSNNYFTGPLKMGNNLSLECSVTDGINPGLVNSTCTETGLDGSNTYGIGNSSDATLTTGMTLTASFVGKVTSDDSANASDSYGYADYPAAPVSFDWSNFENTYRGWGIDGIFGDASSQGRFGCSTAYYYNHTFCVSVSGTWNGSGRIWDWSVATGDTVIRNALALPTGNDTLTHTWSDSSITTFLRNAVEISGDGIGNDNLLCESGETCLYTPNIGSYQGHGNIVSAGAFTDGTLPGSIKGVKLMEYETNGRSSQ